MKYKHFYLIFSLILLLPGIVSLAIYGMNLSIDFTGGSLFRYEFDQINTETRSQIESLFRKKGLEPETINVENKTLVIKTKTTDNKKNEELKKDIAEKFPDSKFQSFETIGPAIGRETAKKSFIAVAVSAIGILLYIAFAFKDIPKPFSSLKFGASAVLAMLHDAFVVIGIFSLLGHFLKVQIDSLFITAILTVIGFSVHDTIVVFDRIRENLKKLPSSWKFIDIVNFSLVETLNRSLSTSLTVVLTLSALLVLGGESIRYFVLALLIGIVSGTYSSIFTASPILVIWEKQSR